MYAVGQYTNWWKIRFCMDLFHLTEAAAAWFRLYLWHKRMISWRHLQHGPACIFRANKKKKKEKKDWSFLATSNHGPHKSQSIQKSWLIRMHGSWSENCMSDQWMHAKEEESFFGRSYYAGAWSPWSWSIFQNPSDSGVSMWINWQYL